MACTCSPSHNSVCDHSNATVWCWVSRAPPRKSCERVYTLWRSRYRHINHRPSALLQVGNWEDEELLAIQTFVLQRVMSILCRIGCDHGSWLRSALLEGFLLFRLVLRPASKG